MTLTTGNVFIRQMCSGDKSNRCDQEKDREDIEQKAKGQNRKNIADRKARNLGQKQNTQRLRPALHTFCLFPKKKKKKNQPRVRRQGAQCLVTKIGMGGKTEGMSF